MIKRALVTVNPASDSASFETLEPGLRRHSGTIEWRVRLLEDGEDVEQATCDVSIDGHGRRLRIRDVSVVNAGFRTEWPVPGLEDRP